ncbi:MAG: hypothetical protein HQ478_09590 [Chloroflexi bacterium]|nr:hypothetical protein [Chloroflexota bacterium]
MAIEEISAPLPMLGSIDAIEVVEDASPGISEITLRGLEGQTLILNDDHVAVDGSGNDWPGWAVAILTEISAVRVSSRSKDRGALIWGVVGAIAAIGVWQVASNDAVSLIGGLVVGVISLILLGEFFLKPPDLQLDIIVGSNVMSTSIKRGQSGEAREFAMAILDTRTRALAPPPAPNPATTQTWSTRVSNFPPLYPGS